MKKLVIAMFAIALVTPMFAQAPPAADAPKAEKTKAAKKGHKASKKKAEQPKAQ